MNNKEIFKLAKNKGFNQLSISGYKSESQMLKFDGGVFENAEESYTDVISITTYRDGKKISRDVSRPTIAKVEKVLDEINQIHEFKTKEIDEFPLKPNGLIYAKPKRSEFKAPSILEIKETILKLTKKIHNVVPNIIKENTMVYYSVNSSKSFKVNSEGMNLKTSQGQSFTLIVGTYIKKGDEQANHYSRFVFKTKDEILSDGVVEKVRNDIVSLSEKQEIKTGTFEIVLDREAFMDLFNQFTNHLGGRSVIDKISVWKNSLGKPIASKNVTLIDVPVLDELGYYITYDADGFPAKERKIIDKGVLKSFFHNAKTASILKQENTGNSFGQNAAPFNMMLEPGTSSDKEIISSVKNGLLIKEFIGLHFGVNNLSGDFSLEITANVISNGKIQKAIKTGVISANFFDDVLNNVEMISSEINHKFAQSNPMVKLKKKLSIAV